MVAATVRAETPEAVLGSLLSEPARADQFTEPFLDAVPLLRIRALLAGLQAEIGEVERIRPDGDGYLVETATHRVAVQVTLAPSGRVAGLFYHPPVRLAVSLSEALSSLGALPGAVAYRIERDGVTLAEAGKTGPVPVGSAFKIGVFDALLATGRDLAEVVVLSERHKSLPSGRLQNLPAGAPITLYVAAAAMIAESDNTATDLLLGEVGREAAAAFEQARLISTRDYFVMEGDPDLRRLFGEDPEAALAQARNRPLPETLSLSVTHSEGTGWHIPLADLCASMGRVADHEIMQINPGPVATSDWAQVAYKGGSLPGVLAFVHHLTDWSGARHCAAVAFAANEPLDETAAATKWRSVLAALARDGQ